MPCEQSLSLSSESQWIESTREASGEPQGTRRRNPERKKLELKKYIKEVHLPLSVLVSPFYLVE